MSRQQSESTASGRETNRELKERKHNEALAREAEGVSCERTKAHRFNRCANPDCPEAAKPPRKPRRKKTDA